ncbi:SDR family oxidoreductase [Amycolatopsis acidicola]|uniref:SDR family oxidoreductase n=1 Tax=Amycolatopsis acidicola TaxID=2596893 RepID=A0A5N0VK52_9PSEU|nr:SDR family oxidoreductase [Amycolatopsis acidicola]KAA9166078.1 SDR family oxidoreductase [Amycolatopsis acidicola]
MTRTALISGAGRGIGASVARALARRRYHVVVNYHSDQRSARQVVADIEAFGGTADLARADVREADDVAALVGDVVARHGRIDALVCNANVPPPFGSVETMPWPDFRDKIEGELAAAFHLTQRVLPVMRGQHAGRIVYVSSQSSESTRPGAIAHASAKAALDAFARHVAAEAGRHGIGVNVIAPAAVRTDATAATLTGEQVAARAARSVLGRILEPDDVAAVVAAVVDTDLAALSATRIPVDAGYRVLTEP